MAVSLTKEAAPVIRFRCNTLRCTEVATWAETLLICGEYVLEDPMCDRHKTDTGFTAIEGDVRPIGTAVVDLSTWSEEEISTLVIL
ncbi:hypothetical protein [Streptomyces sp. CFMR 7]|uniref:hypothetical protein n=1 Tax=Streptomyces sp. CFMR 7 TaxID=1649184 RepID=UPI0011A7B647|nr:hypothetical protein [Streptomyces sp. CFMR 7]